MFISIQNDLKKQNLNLNSAEKKGQIISTIQRKLLMKKFLVNRNL